MTTKEWQVVRWVGIVFLSAASLALLAGAVYGFKSLRYIGSVPSTNTISVSGHADVYTAPTLAEVSFTVEKTAQTSSAAQTQVTTMMNDILAALKKAGIADKDVQTTSYNIYPKYDYSGSCPNGSACPTVYPGRQVLVGYTVSNSVQVKIRNLDSAGDILALLGGKNVTNLSGLSFSVEDPEAPKAEARGKAIDQAKAHAEVLAKQLGVKLVRIISFNENSGSPIYYAKAMGMGASVDSAPSPQVATGENQITSDVNIVYEIK